MLIMNEHGEFVEPWEEPPHLKLKPCGPVDIKDERPTRKPKYGKCRECHGTYEIKSSTHHFCSRRCREKYNRRHKEER